MFEQATLASGPAGKRVWTTILGVTTQFALVSGAILVPMIWPQVMPHSQLLATFVPPLPPGPPVKAVEVKPSAHTQTARPTHPFPLGLVEPTTVPHGVPKIEDEPTEAYVPGAITGDLRATGPGVEGAWFSNLPTNVHVEPPVVVAPVVKPPAAPEPIKQQYRVGGKVQLGHLLHRVEPLYPGIAKAAHVSGTVQLEAVVGTDGRVHSVRVIGGSPLLAKAAQDAVLQWVFEPTRLNDSVIEVIANIDVTFKLNQ